MQRLQISMEDYMLMLDPEHKSLVHAQVMALLRLQVQQQLVHSLGAALLQQL
jgi:hypothetical protein